MSYPQALRGSEIYESSGSVAEYLLFHYGGTDETLGGLPGPSEAVGFATRLVRELMAAPCSDARALDVGCAVGATAFELSKSCGSVIGVDFSNAFVEAATVMKNIGFVTVPRRVEGNRYDSFTATIDALAKPERVEFEVGDACRLRDSIGTFDVVVAANLICRLPEPMAFLSRLAMLVSPGGQLILTTPFTWMDDYTPVDRWVGGTPGVDSFDALKAVLDESFQLEVLKDIPFLIREHRRKFQYSVAQGSRWRRR